MNVWMEDTGVIKTPSVQTRRAYTHVNVIKVLVAMDTFVLVIYSAVQNYETTSSFDSFFQI